MTGLAQLLTYPDPSLAHQESVWGLTINGVRYQFMYIQAADSLIYQLTPTLNLFESEDMTQWLQALKAIRQLSI